MAAPSTKYTDSACKAFVYDPAIWCLSGGSSDCFERYEKECCKERDFCPSATPWYLFYLGGWLPVFITLIVIFGTLVVMKRKERQRFGGALGAPRAQGGPAGTGTGTGTPTDTDYFGQPQQGWNQ